MGEPIRRRARREFVIAHARDRRRSIISPTMNYVRGIPPRGRAKLFAHFALISQPGAAGVFSRYGGKATTDCGATSPLEKAA